MKREITFLALLVIFSGVSGLAQERTAGIIKDLVTRIATDMRELNDRVANGRAERKRLDEEIDRRFAEIEESEDQRRQEAIKAQLIRDLSKANLLDRQQVGAAMRTLERVVPTLARLKSELLALYAQEGVSMANFEEFRKSYGNFLTNSARVIETIKFNLKDPQIQADLAALEDKIVSQYSLHLSPEIGPELSLASIDEAVSFLDAVYVEMLLGQQFLERERLYLTAKASEATGRMVAVNLQEIFQTSGISDFGPSVRHAIQERFSKYKALDDKGLHIRQPTSGVPPQDENVLRMIREGRYPWQKDGTKQERKKR